MNVHESYFLFLVIYIRHNVDVKDHKSDDISIMTYSSQQMIVSQCNDCNQERIIPANPSSLKVMQF